MPARRVTIRPYNTPAFLGPVRTIYYVHGTNGTVTSTSFRTVTEALAYCAELGYLVLNKAELEATK